MKNYSESIRGPPAAPGAPPVDPIVTLPKSRKMSGICSKLVKTGQETVAIYPSLHFGLTNMICGRCCFDHSILLRSENAPAKFRVQWCKLKVAAVIPNSADFMLFS